MTQAEAISLIPGAVVSYQLGNQIVIGIVVQNGPRLDSAGHMIPFMNDLLIVKLGDGPVTISWEPINYPDGISELNL
jgi:hypothetical protein